MAFELDRIAELANLRLNDDEKQAVSEKMNGILKFVDSIVKLELSDLDASVSSYELPTVMREDNVGDTLSQEELSANVPKLDDSSIIVPQVIQK